MSLCSEGCICLKLAARVTYAWELWQKGIITAADRIQPIVLQ